jgi:uncharacterized protein (TIGR02246 family)
MGKLWGGVLLALVLGASTGAVAQEPADAALHDEIRALRDRMVQALNARDIDGLLQGVTENVVFTGINASVVHGRTGIKDYFDRMMVGPDRIVENIQVELEADGLTVLYGGDTGVAYGHSRDHYELTSGLTFDVETPWTATLAKQDGQWRLSSFHASTSIFDNPMLSAATRTLYWSVGIAAAVALLVGFLVGRTAGRRA